MLLTLPQWLPDWPIRLGDVATWLTAIATFIALIFAFRAASTAKGLYVLESERDKQAEEDRKRRDRQQRSEFRVGIVLQIAEAYERYVTGEDEDRAEATIKMRVLLSALPLRYLQILRWELDVYPDARDATLYNSLKSNPAGLAIKTRQHITTLLYELTGIGTNQDYEPPGSPTANRPRRPEED